MTQPHRLEKVGGIQAQVNVWTLAQKAVREKMAE